MSSFSEQPSRDAPTVRRPSRLERPRTRQGAAGRALEDRLGLAGGARKQLNKVFPDNWSFMMGEIALYSFIILILTGTFLTFFFDSSMAEVRYHGSYVPLDGVQMSRAYASTLDISFDVRGGLVVRQIHHWAALLFIAAMMIHMFRVFFTGAFRKPRELNWLIGIGLMTLGLLEGFCGYSMPDDLLSGTGLRIFDAVILSIPVVGTWLSFLIFGGDYPGTVIVGRMYIVHVLIVPGLIAALIGAHLALLVRQKHTDFPGPLRTEHNVVGERLYPTYSLKAGGFFFIVFAVCSGLGGLAQINPVWLWGPYNTAQVSAGSQPDFYIGFLEGSLRLFPSWGIRVYYHTIPPVFWAAVVLPGLMFTAAAIYPFLEARLTHDHAAHHLLQRPRDAPVRTGLGCMAIAFYAVLLASGGNDVIAKAFDISLNAVTWAGRIGLLVLPPLAYLAAYHVCLGLERHDRALLEHGIETGVIRRLPNGEYIELHQPLGPVDEHGHGLLQYAGAAVPKKMNRLGGRRVNKVKGFFFPVREAPDVEEALAEREALEAERETSDISE